MPSKCILFGVVPFHYVVLSFHFCALVLTQHPGVHPSGAPQVVYFAKPGEDLLPPGDGDQWLDRNSQTGGLYGPVGSVGYNNVANHAQRMQQGMGYGGDYSNLPPPKHNGNMWAHPPGSPLSSPTVQSQGFQPHQVGGAQDLYRPQFISSHPLHQSDLQRAIGTPHDACAPGPNAPLSFEDEQSLQSRKRWSVPNYSYPHQPTFHPLAETQGWGPGYIPGRPAPMDRENVRGGGFLPPQQQPSGGMWSGWSVPVGPPGGAPPPPRQHPAEFQGKGNAQTTRAPPSVVENWNKKDGTLELQQLMKSLDISEHLPVLRVSGTFFFAFFLKALIPRKHTFTYTTTNVHVPELKVKLHHCGVCLLYD